MTPSPDKPDMPDVICVAMHDKLTVVPPDFEHKKYISADHDDLAKVQEALELAKKFIGETIAMPGGYGDEEYSQMCKAIAIVERMRGLE